MNIIRRTLLKNFVHKHADAGKSLRVWSTIVQEANWRTPKDISFDFPNASFINGTRVRFKINHNKYRLICEVDFPDQTVEVRFIGTHSDYDRVDASTV
jgi:mRNA interferase HigB